MKRQRKDGYWAAYHAAQPTQKDFVVEFIKDRVGYDSDQNCEAVFDMGMLPNILQRKSENSGDRRNVGKPSRRRAGEMFDPVRYQKRKMIEWIFGAEESSNRRLRCRFRKKGTRERFGACWR